VSWFVLDMQLVQTHHSRLDLPVDSNGHLSPERVGTPQTSAHMQSGSRPATPAVSGDCAITLMQYFSASQGSGATPAGKLWAPQFALRCPMASVFDQPSPHVAKTLDLCQVSPIMVTTRAGQIRFNRWSERVQSGGQVKGYFAVNAVFCKVRPPSIFSKVCACANFWCLS